MIFVFRAMPGPGAGSTWWMIDVLGFDQSFLAKLSLIASVLTLFGLFGFRRFMGERSIAYIVGFLTLTGTLLSLPTLGMYHGLHEWTAAHTGGIVDARFIALIDTALESPLGQIAMVPMLAWIANSAPANLKATYFAVMASFTNLALSASQLGTKYLNQLFEVTREIRDPVTQATKMAADYSQLGALFMISIAPRSDRSLHGNLGHADAQAAQRLRSPGRGARRADCQAGGGSGQFDAELADGGDVGCTAVQLGASVTRCLVRCAPG